MTIPTKPDMAQALPIEQVIAFLLGEDEIYGFWYGETPEGKGPYWWRSYLRESWKAAKRACIGCRGVGTDGKSAAARFQASPKRWRCNGAARLNCLLHNT